MDHASFSLDSQPLSDSTCPHCGKTNQSVSHGYVYKWTSDHHREVVGKRILCSRRYGRSGCGRTRQWYLADVVPQCQYRLSVFIAFIHALLAGDAVETAYTKTIVPSPNEPRQAWRWLQRFMKQLPRWRSCLSLTDETFEVKQRSSPLKKLLPTLKALSNKFDGLDNIQYQWQQCFC